MIPGWGLPEEGDRGVTSDRQSHEGRKPERYIELGRHTGLGDNTFCPLEAFKKIFPQRWIPGKFWEGQLSRQRLTVEIRQLRLERERGWVARATCDMPCRTDTQGGPGWRMAGRRPSADPGCRRVSKGELGPSTL